VSNNIINSKAIMRL